MSRLNADATRGDSLVNIKKKQAYKKTNEELTLPPGCRVAVCLILLLSLALSVKLPVVVEFDLPVPFIASEAYGKDQIVMGQKKIP